MDSSFNDDSKHEYSLGSGFIGTPMKKYPITRKSLEDYKRIAFSSDSEPVPERLCRKPTGVLKPIAEFLLKCPSGATLLEIAEHLQLHWPGLKATKGYSYGKGSAKRIALGALNESKAFELYENPLTGVKMWRIKEGTVQTNEADKNIKENKKKAKTRKIPLSMLKTKIKIPKTTKGKAKYKEILTLLEALYERLELKIGEALIQANVLLDKLEKIGVKRRGESNRIAKSIGK